MGSKQSAIMCSQFNPLFSSPFYSTSLKIRSEKILDFDFLIIVMIMVSKKEMK